MMNEGRQLLINAVVDRTKSAPLNDPTTLVYLMMDIATVTNMIRIEGPIIRNNGRGYSCMLMCDHGHISIRTHPREGQIAIDVYRLDTFSLVPIKHAIKLLYDITSYTEQFFQRRWL